MAYRTLNEWNARGRQVKKGEKAMGKLNDGSALFGKEQTQKTRLRVHTNTYSSYDSETNWDQSMDWDECHEQGLLIGLPGQF